MVMTKEMIEGTIQCAIGMLYEVENLNDQLIDNEPCLAENGESFERMRTYLRNLKKELTDALAKYDDLAK